MAQALQGAFISVAWRAEGGWGQSPLHESWSQSFRLDYRGKDIQPKKRSCKSLFEPNT